MKELWKFFPSGLRYNADVPSEYAVLKLAIRGSGSWYRPTVWWISLIALMMDFERQGRLSLLKQILVFPRGDRTLFYTEAGHVYLCNSQACLCNMKSVSAGGVPTFGVRTSIVQMGQ